jgi:hypothetical protein
MRGQHGSILLVQRAFVLHLDDGWTPGRRQFSGRIEHLSSGESTLFSSLEELLAFIDAAVDASAPVAVAEAPGPSRHGGTVALPAHTNTPAEQCSLAMKSRARSRREGEPR